MSDQSSNELRRAATIPVWLPYAALVALTLLIYAPTFNYGFVWDDYDYIVDNFRIQGLSPAHWRAIWLYPFSGLYSPVHHSLLALLYHLGGLDPFIYHVAQVTLHAACACLLYTLITRIETANVAAIAAALFVVHPTNVENVAWISETKSTLALLCLLVSMLLFLRQAESGSWRDAAACVGLFALSLLAKPSAVVAPALLLLLAWQRNQLTRVRLLLIGALLACGVALTLLTMKYLAAIGAQATPDRLADATLLAPGAAYLPNVKGYYGGLAIHLLNLPGLIFHYFMTIIWPARLSSWQMFPIETGWNAGAALLWTGFLLTIGGVAWAWFSPRGRLWAFWAMWFLVLLVPVLQIVPNPIWVADRYLYIPAIGLFVLFAKFIVSIADRADELNARRAVLAAPALVIIAFTWISTQYLPAWRNDVSLWSNAMSTCDGSAYCHGMLSIALRREARELGGEEQNRLRQAAVQEAVRSATLRPTPQKFVYLGDALLDVGDPRALDAYLKTREIMGQIPVVYWVQIAKAHYRFGHLDEAASVIASLQPVGAEDPSILMVDAFVKWKQGQQAAARADIEKIMAMNTLYPQGPDRTLKFVSHYWDNAAEAAQMLQDVRAQ